MAEKSGRKCEITLTLMERVFDMANLHRFSLVFNGVSVSSIDDLRKNYSERDAFGYYQNGLLCKWLIAWDYKTEYDLMMNLPKADESSLKKAIRDILMGKAVCMQKKDEINSISSVPGKLPKIKLAAIGQEKKISDFDVNLLSLSQVIENNPVLKEKLEIRQIYFYGLTRYIKLGKWKSTYISAQIELYKKALCGKNSDGGKALTNSQFKTKSSLIAKYVYLLIFDLFSMIGFSEEKMLSENMKVVLATMLIELPLKFEDLSRIVDIHSAVIGKEEAWKRVKEIPQLGHYWDYVDSIRTNLSFKNKRPVRFLVTATMSAGKSTFINALAGKNINLSKNMACTSKIHHLLSKPYEDGYTSKCDGDFILNANDKELMNNSEKNLSSDIFMSTCFSGLLKGKRIMLCDSPGVNSSKNADHQYVTEKMVEKHEYDMVLYVINATQIGTNDDQVHLSYIHQNIGNTPIIFIVNKIDEFREDEDNIAESLNDVIKYLKQVGFTDPVVCPVSAYAGFLAKTAAKGIELSFVHEDMFRRNIRYFKSNDISWYYEKYYPEIHMEEPKDKINQLIKHSGLIYIEKIISRYC